jgi:FtsZ-binding cell division protein ZapB
MNEYIYQIIGAIATTIIGYVAGYRKQNVDLQSSRLDSLEKSINVYNLIIDDMASKIETLTTEVAGLEKRIEELMTENKQLKNKNSI